MPTEYTAGILDGTINTFEDFAKLCTRAFGAAIHMREEPLSAPYEPAKPSEYYYNRVKELLLKHEAAMVISDAELIANETERLNNGIQHCKDVIVKRIQDAEKLSKFLRQAKDWQPPTEEHKEFKQFLEKQLYETIKFDTDSDYYEQRLMQLENELDNLDAGKQREIMLKDISEDLDRAKEGLKKEEENCESRNKWVETLWQSLTAA